MNAAPGARHKTTFLVLAAVVIVLGVLSALDVSKQTYTGLLTDGDNGVISVEAGSPAATAGLQVGDRLKSVNGVAVTDTKGSIAMHRPAVGDVWPYVVSRGGQDVSLQVGNAALPSSRMLTARAATVLGLLFVAFTLWAYLTVPNAATTVLALFGLSFGLAFLGIPYFESPSVRNAIGALVTVVVLLGIAAILHFLLAFPTRRPMIDRPNGLRLIYWPAVALSVILLGFTIVQPDATSKINVMFRTLFNLFIAGYFLAALVTLFRRYGAATPEDRARYGLGLMLVGAVVGLGPLLVSGVIGLVAPRIVLPGSQYYFLTLALIPLTFALAASKGTGELVAA